jgi:hypothetical protein
MKPSSLACQEKVQNDSDCRKAYAYSFGRDSRRLLLEHYQERAQQCTLLAIVGRCVTS